jgi:hypothetical protein
MKEISSQMPRLRHGDGGAGRDQTIDIKENKTPGGER